MKTREEWKRIYYTLEYDLDGFISAIQSDAREELQKENAELRARVKEVEEERTISDTLASALLGEYPDEDAMKRYCASLAKPSDAQTVLAKFRSNSTRKD